MLVGIPMKNFGTCGISAGLPLRDFLHFAVNRNIEHLRPLRQPGVPGAWALWHLQTLWDHQRYLGPGPCGTLRPPEVLGAWALWHFETL